MNEYAALAGRILEALTGPGASRAGLTAWELKMRLKAPHTALHLALGMLLERRAVTLTPSDTVAPSVTITNPTDGGAVSGPTKIAASATDNVAVMRLEVYVDGVLKTSTASNSISYNWNVNKGVQPGSHTIVVKGYDAASNVSAKTITAIR